MVNAQTPLNIRIVSEPSLPFWQEVLFGLDWLSLRLSPVYYGLGVPQGDGSPVILIPGFLGTDSYLMEMYNWLRRIGYQPYNSGIGRNADCLQIIMQQIFTTMDKAYEETGCRLRLVGHSLGGILARAAAVLRAEQVSQVITLASPYRSVRAHPFVIGVSDFIRNSTIKKRRENGEVLPGCYTDQCSCETVETIRKGIPPDSVSRAAIYTKTDGVVDWKCCIEDDDSLNTEVLSTHTGLVFNPDSFRAIAERLTSCR